MDLEIFASSTWGGWCAIWLTVITLALYLDEANIADDLPDGERSFEVLWDWLELA